MKGLRHIHEHVRTKNFPTDSNLGHPLVGYLIFSCFDTAMVLSCTQNNPSTSITPPSDGHILATESWRGTSRVISNDSLNRSIQSRSKQEQPTDHHKYM